MVQPDASIYSSNPGQKQRPMPSVSPGLSSSEKPQESLPPRLGGLAPPAVGARDQDESSCASGITQQTKIVKVKDIVDNPNGLRLLGNVTENPTALDKHFALKTAIHSGKVLGQSQKSIAVTDAKSFDRVVDVSIQQKSNSEIECGAVTGPVISEVDRQSMAQLTEQTRRKSQPKTHRKMNRPKQKPLPMKSLHSIHQKRKN